MLFFSPTCSFIRTKHVSYKGISRKTNKTLARSFHFTFRYLDDVFSLSNSLLCDFVDRTYTIALDTTATDKSASYRDLHSETDSERW